LTTISKPNQRKLERLSSKYERVEESTRTYHQDRADIETLVKDGVIDHAHGLELLAEAARVKASKDKTRKTKEAEAKAKERALRNLTPIGVVFRPKPRVDYVGALEHGTQGALAFVKSIVMLIILLAVVYAFIV
jgi:hypothetical protein